MKPAPFDILSLLDTIHKIEYANFGVPSNLTIQLGPVWMSLLEKKMVGHFTGPPYNVMGMTVTEGGGAMDVIVTRSESGL